jgi:ubiquitin conjugation factor E4 B
MLALETLLTSKPVASIFTQLDGFAISEQDLPYTIPVTTLLGPFLALSPINFASRKANFPNPDFLPARDTHRLYGDIRSEYRVVQNRLFEICNKIVRGSATSRKDLLKYFGKVLDPNGYSSATGTGVS